jgi:hypothetical protein
MNEWMTKWLQYSLSLLLKVIFVASVYSRSPSISKKNYSYMCVCVCVCVASHYAIVQYNSSFMFKFSIFYMPKTNRVLTVSVQVSALDNILMYSYVHNICLYFSLPYWRNVNFCFICFILGRPWVQFQLKSLKISIVFFSSLCKCQDIISNYVMNINFHTSPGNLSVIFTSVNTVQCETLKTLLQKLWIHAWKDTGISWFMLFVWVQVYKPSCSFPPK